MSRNALYAAPLMWLITAGVVGDPHLKPGAWRETWRVKIQTVDGKPVASERDDEKPEVSEECLDGEDMGDTEKFFSEEVVEQGCTNLEIKAINGDIKIAGSCTFDNVAFSGTGNGHYDERSYFEGIKFSARTGGHTFTASGTLSGNYVRDCVPDDDVKPPV